MGEALLRVRHLTTRFRTDAGVLRAVDDVSLEVYAGKTLALVGESGSGKSVTALSLMRLVPSPPGEIEAGEVLLDGRDLMKLTERELRDVRGRELAMVFQEPMTSLNPVYTVGSQVAEALRIHERVSARAARERAVELLELVGIPSPGERAGAYPHELSGGMRQRVMTAMALSCSPKVLIADEPTTALDVTIQAQILDLFARLQRELGMGILFITHDLGVVAEFASQVAVMYAGRVVERAAVEELFEAPAHPYTSALLASLPTLSDAASGERRLPVIEGVVPSLLALPRGCRFADRCAFRRTEPGGAAGLRRCDEEEPELTALAGRGERSSRCHFAAELLATPRTARSTSRGAA